MTVWIVSWEDRGGLGIGGGSIRKEKRLRVGMGRDNRNDCLFGLLGGGSGGF